MKPLYIVVGIVAVLAWLAVGLLVASGPQPEIIVPAEVITKVGPLNLTNTLITSWVVMVVIIVLSLVATRSMKLIPSGAQNFFEGIIQFLLDQMSDIVGETKARKFFAVIATIFIYIIVSNWFGLLPFFNAIGKTEDVHYHVWHELTNEHPHDLVLVETEDEAEETGYPVGTYAEDHKFSGVSMDGGSVYTVKPGEKAVHFHVHAGETPAEAMDRYIVFVAHTFAGFEEFEGEEITEEVLEHPSDAIVIGAAEALEGNSDAPNLVFGEHAEDGEESEGAEEGEEHHGLESPALGETVEGIDFENSAKLMLVIPLFRGTFSDINNTLAMGIIAFFCIEFWGFQALGIGYLKKFFNLNGINSFVGILELLSEFIRIISFAFRLFGNIFAGEVLILMLTFLMPFLFVDVIYMLELFVGFIQASVFALLTLVFAGMATESHDDHGDEHHEAHDGATHGTAQAH